MIQRTITRNIKRDYLFTTSLKPLPALNAGTFEAGISIDLPVLGSQPVLAFL